MSICKIKNHFTNCNDILFNTHSIEYEQCFQNDLSRWYIKVYGCMNERLNYLGIRCTMWIMLKATNTCIG